MKTILSFLCLSFFLLMGCQSEVETQVFSDIENNVEPSEALPMFMTTMTHMEGNSTDDKIEKVFNLHVKQIRYAMDLADEYNAILTFESEKPFAIANSTWDLNIMREIVEKGHGGGTHCDIGANKLMDYDDFVAALIENKALVDDLIGKENNKGCSGAGGPNDWVQGALDAGFIYINGLVGFHLLAFDQEDRLEDWTNQYIKSGAFHYSIPVDYLARLNFSQLANTEDWVDDGEGIVVSNGEFGQLARLEEGGWEGGCENSGPGEDKCPLTMNDVDIWVDIVMEMDAQRDQTQYAKLSLYFPVNQWDEANEDVLRYFFSEMQRLQEEGVILWATQLDAVETYLNSKQ